MAGSSRPEDLVDELPDGLAHRGVAQVERELHNPAWCEEFDATHVRHRLQGASEVRLKRLSDPAPKGRMWCASIHGEKRPSLVHFDAADGLVDDDGLNPCVPHVQRGRREGVVSGHDDPVNT